MLLNNWRHGTTSHDVCQKVGKPHEHMIRTNDQSLSNTMASIRRRLRFELLKATLIAVRGHRGRYYQKALPIEEQDLNLVEEANTDDV